ncbi:MAG: 4-hydroxybutyrate--acetyl-CoA CoA transferase [Bacteroidia bacterium]|nr:4-hydroxybutyrate--acetyl-CoA CoA transferase [Bacteroidia bacterium]
MKHDIKAKIITVDEALKLVKSNDHIFTGLGAGEGREFLSKLHTLHGKVQNITVTNCLPMMDYEFYMNPTYKDTFKLAGWFYNAGMRKAHANGNVSFVPNVLHYAGTKRLDHVHPNIYIGIASLPDEHGFVSLSLGNTYEKQVIKEADLIILEINPNAPRTFGDLELHVNDVDYLIEVDYQIPEIPDTEPNEKDLLIGKYISELINDGDCIQLGIGGIPNAVAKSLYGKKDLGVHTEMLTNEMAKLANAGVITGKHKQLFPGKMVATFAMGSRALYDFIDNNPSVMLLAGSYVNDPYVIAKNDNQVSINTTLEVDVTGQCCSESIGSKQFSGTGGQSDTAIGAQNSKNGRSIIALYSTANVRNPLTGEREEVSKIVCQLKPGAAVSLSRNDLHYLCTEYGIVNLRGTTIEERVEKIISIAHPKFRASLREEAIALGIIGA